MYVLIITSYFKYLQLNNKWLYMFKIILVIEKTELWCLLDAMCSWFKADISFTSKKAINVYNTANISVNIPWIHRTDDQFHADILLLILVFPVHTPDIRHEKQMSVPTPRDKPAANKPWQVDNTVSILNNCSEFKSLSRILIQLERIQRVPYTCYIIYLLTNIIFLPWHHL